MEIGYWGVKGRAHPLRMLIAYTGLEVNEVNPSSGEDWGARKAAFGAQEGCLFPNLPYVKDGNKITTENVACAAALAFKANRAELVGKTPGDQTTHLSMMSVCSDLFGTFAQLCGKTRAEVQQAFPDMITNNIRPKLQGFCKILNTRPFLLYYVTVADFYLVYLYDLYDYLAQKCGVQNPFNEFPPLLNLRKNVWALPGIKEFQSHSVNQRPPMPPPMIKFLQA